MAALRSKRLSGNITDWPPSADRWRSSYSMRAETLDRFGARLEHRLTQGQIKAMMEQAGLIDIRFSPAAPCWRTVGRKR